MEDENEEVEDLSSDKNSKSSNGDIVNGEIDGEGGGGDKDVEEEAVSMES